MTHLQQPMSELESATEARTGFRIHAVVTATVSVLLVIINIATPTSFPWAVFPVLGMAIGLTIHWYFAVHTSPGANQT